MITRITLVTRTDSLSPMISTSFYKETQHGPTDLPELLWSHSSDPNGKILKKQRGPNRSNPLKILFTSSQQNNLKHQKFTTFKIFLYIMFHPNVRKNIQQYGKIDAPHRIVRYTFKQCNAKRLFKSIGLIKEYSHPKFLKAKG